MERNVNMKTIVRIGDHCVVRGMDINEYAHLVGNPVESINSIEDLCHFRYRHSKVGFH